MLNALVVVLHHGLPDAPAFCLCLRPCGFRLESSGDLERDAAAILWRHQRGVSAQCGPQIRARVRGRSTKCLWHHADHGEISTIYCDLRRQRTRIAAEPATPEAITQHGGRLRHAFFVLSVQYTPVQGTHAERLEEIRRDATDGHVLRRSRSGNRVMLELTSLCEDEPKRHRALTNRVIV